MALLLLRWTPELSAPAQNICTSLLCFRTDLSDAAFHQKIQNCILTQAVAVKGG